MSCVYLGVFYAITFICLFACAGCREKLQFRYLYNSKYIFIDGWVILNEGFEASSELEKEIIEYCRDNMAAYKRPRWVEFVGELPKTATGKIQRYKLRSA